jgi:hypothetical protein
MVQFALLYAISTQHFNISATIKHDAANQSSMS